MGGMGFPKKLLFVNENFISLFNFVMKKELQVLIKQIIAWHLYPPPTALKYALKNKTIFIQHEFVLVSLVWFTTLVLKFVLLLFLLLLLLAIKNQ